MIRVFIKDFSLKENSYKLAVLHHSGMVVDFNVSMAAPMKELIEKINQAVAFSEVQMAVAFYTGDEVKDGQKLVTEDAPKADAPVHQGNEEVPEIKAGSGSIQSTD